MKEKSIDDSPFTVVGKYFSVQSGNFYNYPVELQKAILETENGVLKKKASATELESLVVSNPDIPEFKALLFLVYDNQGRNAKMFEIALRTVDEHPGYLAGKCYLGLQYILKDEVEKVFRLFNGFSDLKALFPERTGFLSTEEVDYLFMGIAYFASVGNIHAANRWLDGLKTRNPDYLLLGMAERIVENASLHRWESMEKEWEPKRRRVKYINRSLPQVTGNPAFENPEVGLFYQKDLDFDNWEIGCFLDLPRESFIRDLEKVILDARQRYQYFFYEDDTQEFPDPVSVKFLSHAVLFLTECKAVDRLPLILGLLEEDETFFYDWFDEYFDVCMIPAIYELGQHQLDVLKNFMFIPNLTFLTRDAVADAVSRIAIHQPERRMEVIGWFDEVFQYFIDHREDDGIVDTDLIGYMVIYCTEIAARELLDAIKKLFAFDLASIDICGPMDEVEADLSDPVDEKDIPHFLTIFEQYDFFRSELEELFEANDEEDDENDYFEAENQVMKSLVKRELERTERLNPDEIQMPVTIAKTPGRNDPCPCGSGKKYKKCCLKL